MGNQEKGRGGGGRAPSRIPAWAIPRVLNNNGPNLIIFKQDKNPFVVCNWKITTHILTSLNSAKHSYIDKNPPTNATTQFRTEVTFLHHE